MNLDFKTYRKRHRAFWSLEDVERPLVGFTIGAGADAWSYWQYNRAAQELFNRHEITPEDIHPEEFVAGQHRYLAKSAEICDDVCRTAMPLASIPWMEAILGCPVNSSGSHLQAGPILDNPALLKTRPFDMQNKWIRKYFEFIEIYYQAFGEKFPVAQSVVRGPSDLACALLGVENATIALLENQESMHRLLGYACGHLEEFLKLHLNRLPKFHDGYVIGQYEIWAPEPVLRIQEDFSVLYSPQLYREFLKPLDEKLAALSNYTLIHLHAPSLFLINIFLEIKFIHAYQVTKDIGSVLNDMIPALQNIQSAGRPLIIKGQFDMKEIDILKQTLSPRGLCIQPVVRTIDEAQRIFPILCNWQRRG
jgi:hypothetical protein